MENKIKNRGYYKYPPDTLSILPQWGERITPHVDVVERLRYLDSDSTDLDYTVKTLTKWDKALLDEKDKI